VNPFHAILLGIVQGLTEFLPISSTAHLTLAGKLFGLIDPHDPEAWTAFIAVMQLGTLAAVCVYFYRDILVITSYLMQDVMKKGLGGGFGSFSTESRLGIYVIIGTIPVGLAGLLFKKIIEGTFTKTTLVIIGSLVLLACLLWIAEKVARHTRMIGDMKLKDALLIGLAQACALIPGSSRSGTTITAGLMLKFDRHSAATFSFLLSIPAVLASGLYELSKIDWSAFRLGWFNLVIAILVSGISGYAAIFWLLKYLMKHTTMVFVWYRIGLGVLLAIMLYLDLIQQ